MGNPIFDAIGNAISSAFGDLPGGGGQKPVAKPAKRADAGGRDDGPANLGMRRRMERDASGPSGLKANRNRAAGDLKARQEAMAAKTAKAAAPSGGRPGRGNDGRTEGERAADAATMESGPAGPDGYSPEIGDNEGYDILNKRIQDDIASGKLKFADGYDTGDVDWIDIAMGDVYSNPFASLGTKDYERDGMMYTNLSDDAQQARSDYLYSLFNDPELSDVLGDSYLGDSRSAWDEYFRSTMDGDTMADVINDFGTLGHMYTGGDDAMVEELMSRVLKRNADGESLADYIDIGGNVPLSALSALSHDPGNADEETLEAAVMYMLDQQLDAVNSGDVAVEDLGYSMSDLNKLARAENLIYTHGDERGANTEAHRGNPVQGTGFDDEWEQRIQGPDGAYGAGRVNRAIPVRNFADDMFQAYGGLGYVDYDENRGSDVAKRYGRG